MEHLVENDGILLDWRSVSVVSTADVLFEEMQLDKPVLEVTDRPNRR